MPNYRVVLRTGPDEEPAPAISLAANNPYEALLIAQRHDCPAELWKEGKHICTLTRTGSHHEVWVVTPAGAE